MKLFFKKTTKDKEKELLPKCFYRMMKHTPENQRHFDEIMGNVMYEYYEAIIRSENKTPIPREFLEDKDLECYAEPVFKLIINSPTLSVALVTLSSFKNYGIEIKEIKS